MPAAGRFSVQELASSWASGVILILSGLAVAAYGMPSGNDAPASALQTVIGHSAEAGQSADQDRRVVASMPARSAAGPSARAAKSASTPVVVTVIPRPSEPTTVPPRTASIPRDREALARELQKELRRRLLRGRAQRGMDPRHAPGHEGLHRRRQRHPSRCGARRGSAHHGARPAGPGVRQAVSARTGNQRGRTLSAERHPRQGGEEGAIGHGRIVAEGRSGTACEAWPRRRQLDGHGGRGSASLTASCCRGSCSDIPDPNRRAYGLGRARRDPSRPRPAIRRLLQSGTCAHVMQRGQGPRATSAPRDAGRSPGPSSGASTRAFNHGFVSQRARPTGQFTTIGDAVRLS